MKKVCEFVDIEKVYEHVNRRMLWNVLKQYVVEEWLTVSNNFTIDVQSYAEEMYTSLIQRAVAAVGNGRVSLNNTEIDLAGGYLLNLNNRYADDITAFQVYGEATQFLDETSQNPVILINFQYPKLTIYNNFTLSSQDGENIANGQIITVVTNYTFQFELYTKIRSDGVLDYDLVQLSIQNTGSLTQNVVVEEGKVDEDINESILAVVSNDYNTNTAVDIEKGITNFAEFAYQDVDLTNYLRYHLLENTVIDIQSYSRDLLEDRQRFIKNDFNGVVRLNDIRKDITTAENETYYLEITGRTVVDTSSLEILGLGSYSYNESDSALLKLFVNFVYPRLTMDYDFSVTNRLTNESSRGSVSVIVRNFNFLYERWTHLVEYNYLPISERFPLRTYGADSVFVNGDDVPEEVRQLIKRLIKESYRNNFGDADTMAFWFNNYIYSRPRDGDIDINDYIFVS